MAKPKIIDRREAPYGAWKLTEAEYQAARNISEGNGPLAEAAWQVVRYCRGEIFQRDAAAEFIRMHRAGEVA